ncbi:MAG: hypothetical protein Q9225_001931 [Loekoesia sp. 1 TL-2023]
MPSTEGLQSVPPWLDLQMFSAFSHIGSLIGVAEADANFKDIGNLYYVEDEDTNLGMGSPYLSPIMAPVAPYTETLVHERVLSNRRAAEFLALRETEDFKKMAFILRGANGGGPRAPASSITYNPEKETITLKGYSKSIVERAKTTLECIYYLFKYRRGEHLVTSHSGTEYEAPRSQASKFDFSSAHSNESSEGPKIFAIKPKDDEELIENWFNRLLPALPKILKQILGGNYTASLVRRGRNGLEARPCIQIESPHIPGKEAQGIIKDKVNDLYNKDGGQPIDIRFLQGSFRKLNGGAEGENDGAEQSADLQRLRFNLFRPYPKPGMGASLGLLCSRKISSTLGGYVLIDGTKYMLTSDHLFMESRKPGNKDCNEKDGDTLTSPSREDLIHLKSCLQQTKRDIESEIDQRMQKEYGNKEIAEENLSDKSLTPELRDARNRYNDIINYIGQVAKPPSAYAISTVVKRSNEPRTVAVSRHLADQVDFGGNTITHYMDWALCKLTRETGEIRHKYRSNQDAMDDGYVDEQAHVNQSTDICHETCDADSAIDVYYVGQGSGHRSGVVNIPMLVSRDDSITHEWTILSSEGQDILHPHVAGDSGAWVIRKHGNKLMGQVFAHSTGQVLFTPINVIFADLKKHCDLDVSLPPASQNPGQNSIAAFAIPLSSGSVSRPVESFRSLLKPAAALASLGIPAIGVDLSETRPVKSSTELNSPRETDNVHGQASSSPLLDSPSSPPSLTNSPKSSITTPGSQQSSRSSRGVDLSDAHVEIEKLSSESPQTIISNSTESEIPFLTLDEHSEEMISSRTFQFKSELHFRTTLKARTPTLPVDRRSKVTKAGVWSGVFSIQNISRS